MTWDACAGVCYIPLKHADFCYNTQIYAAIRRILPKHEVFVATRRFLIQLAATKCIFWRKYADFCCITQIFATTRRFLLQYVDFCYGTQILATILRFFLQYADFCHNTLIFVAICRILLQYIGFCCNTQMFGSGVADGWVRMRYVMYEWGILHIWMMRDACAGVCYNTHYFGIFTVDRWVWISHVLYRWVRSRHGTPLNDMNTPRHIRMSHVTSCHIFKWRGVHTQMSATTLIFSALSLLIDEYKEVTSCKNGTCHTCERRQVSAHV